MLRPAVDRLPPRASGRRRPRSARGPATHANERTPSLHHRVGRPPAGRSTRFPCAITSPPVPRVPRVAGCPHEGPRSRAVPRAAISRGTLRHDLRMTTRGFFVCSRLVTLVEPGFLRNCHALRREMDDRARAAARCIASAWEGSGSARSEMPIRQATREFPPTMTSTLRRASSLRGRGSARPSLRRAPFERAFRPANAKYASSSGNSGLAKTPIRYTLPACCASPAGGTARVPMSPNRNVRRLYRIPRRTLHRVAWWLPTLFNTREFPPQVQDSTVLPVPMASDCNGSHGGLVAHRVHDRARKLCLPHGSPEKRRRDTRPAGKRTVADSIGPQRPPNDAMATDAIATSRGSSGVRLSGWLTR